MNAIQKRSPGITIVDGPQNWQIIQRDGNGEGRLTIRGTWSCNEQEYAVQARIVNETDQMPVTPELDWQDAELDTEAERFTISFNRIPQGGLYRVETRLRRPLSQDRRAMRGDCIHHLGVGDIYIIAGQSNASGTGKGVADDGPLLGVHLFGNDECWKLATHPIEDATNTLHPITFTSVFHGHSPWIAFGKAIYEKTGVPVGLIPTALGGSPISMWVRDESGTNSNDGILFDNMADMLDKTGGQAAGVVWYQGETDAIIGAVEAYPSKFRSMVQQIRRLLLNESLPIFTAQLNAYVPADANEANWSQMREVQRKLADEISGVHLIVTVDCGLSDEIHNSALSNVVIGRRFATAALEHIYSRPVRSAFPDLAEAMFADKDRQLVKLTFRNVCGDWTPMSRPLDFTVEDADGIVPLSVVTTENPGIVRLRLERAPRVSIKVHGLYGSSPRPTLFDDNGRCITPFTAELSV